VGALPFSRSSSTAGLPRSREAQTLDAVARLAGGVARDFNEFLTVIAGRAERALELLPGEDPARAAVLDIQAAGRAAAEAANDLLAASGRQVLAPVRVDVNGVVRRLIRTLPGTLTPGVHARFDLAAGLPDLEIDPDQLIRAMRGLISRACEAMPDGGTITIATRATGERGSRVVRLSITDTGTAIDPAIRERVFEPFAVSMGRRSGLVLSVAHGIITQCGGSISVESDGPGGSTFTLALPA